MGGARGCENHVIVWKKSIIFSVLFCSSINMGIHSSFAIVVFFFFYVIIYNNVIFPQKKKFGRISSNSLAVTIYKIVHVCII